MRRCFSLLAFCALAAAASAATVMQPGFTDTVFATNLPQPTGLEWAPDGSRRLFVSLQRSGLMTIGPGGAHRWFLKYRAIYSQSECGSLGFCFDPNFVHNRFVYSFVTVSAKEQRIMRSSDFGTAVGAVAIVGGLPTRGVNHNGGALGFGGDARLYWAVGDNGIKRGVDGDLTLLNAKVGRAFQDGSVPRDNPFLSVPAPRNGFIWATGFRNPFTLTVQPRTGLLWLNVVGSTPDGQTVPDTTPGYEQIFVLRGGEDGGYDDYEGNQPSGNRFSTPPRPLAYPVLQYKTDYANEPAFSRSLASIGRQAGVLTAVTSAAHPFRVGQIVVVAGTDAFDGPYLVHQVTGPNGFTALSSGADLPAVANQGVARPTIGDGCITGGAFYESTAFPAELRGGFFFGDVNSGTLWELLVDSQNQPTEIRRLLANAGAITDVALGPDGALYYTNLGEGSVHRLAFQQPTELIVTPTNFQMVEGGNARFSVRLPSAPSADVDVTVAPVGSVVSVTKGATLKFTPKNWQQPQAVTVRAALDSDVDAASDDLTISAPGFPPETVHVSVIDTSADAPKVSVQTLTVPRGQTRTLQVALPSQPAKAVTIVARRVSGSAGASVRGGASLVFTPDNWNVPRTVTIGMGAKAPALPTSVEIWGRGYFRRTVTVQPQ